MTDSVMNGRVVPLIDEPKGLLRRFAWRYSRKTFGEVVDPVRALAHHGGDGDSAERSIRSNEEIVELVCWIALENYRSRINAGLGLHSQGFAARCELAAAVLNPDTLRRLS
jgi:hypothetical protein